MKITSDLSMKYKFMQLIQVLIPKFHFKQFLLVAMRMKDAISKNSCIWCLIYKKKGTCIVLYFVNSCNYQYIGQIAWFVLNKKNNRDDFPFSDC